MNISAREYKPKMDEVRRVLSTKIYDNHLAILMALAAMICRKHILLTSLRGRGKTAMSRFFQMIIEGAVEARIQGTPELMGSDFTGKPIFDEKVREYIVKWARAMTAHVVLFDEINRMLEAIQAFLMELLEEGQMTIDGETFRLPPFHFWIGTRNPEGQAGTTKMSDPLRDRFILDVDMKFPEREALIDLGYNTKLHRNVDEIRPLLTMDEIVAMGEYNDHMVETMSRSVAGYAADLTSVLQSDLPEFRKLKVVPDPRKDPQMEKDRLKGLLGKSIYDLQVLDDGLSPRAYIWMRHAACALAFLDGLEEPEDTHIDKVWIPTGRHKLMVRPIARAMGITAVDILNSAQAYVKQLRHRG